MMRFYRVAGHVFGVDFPSDFPVDTVCANYAPFRLDGFAGEPLFVLSWADSLPPFEGEVVVRQEDDGADQPRLLLRRNAGGWCCRMAPRQDMPWGVELLMQPGFRHATACVLHPGPSWMRFAVDNALMLLMTFATAPLQTLLIHASAVVFRGRAYAFLAPSGTGKSTHSRLWMEHLPDVELLNDDNPVIRVGADGTVCLYGAPWSGKTPCYKQKVFPLGALVQLVQAPANTIRRLPLIEAYGALFSSTSGLKHTEPMVTQQHGTLEQVLLRTPCYHLDCLPDAGAALLCSSTIVSD